MSKLDDLLFSENKINIGVTSVSYSTYNVYVWITNKFRTCL